MEHRIESGPEKSATRQKLLDAAASLAAITAAILLLWLTFSGPRRLVPLKAQSESAIPDQPVRLDGVHMEGARDAQVAILEFSDFACPFCATFARETLPALRREYIGVGSVRFGLQHLPLGLHSQAGPAAAAAECAAQEGRFWPMHDRLFVDSRALDVSGLADAARAVGLDPGRFSRCLADGRTAARVHEDAASAHALGVTGTPSFMVGVVDSGGRLRVRRRLNGAQPFSVFKEVLDGLLGQADPPYRPAPR